MAPAPVAETPVELASEAPETEPEGPLDPVLSFESFGKMPDVPDEEWAQIQQAVRNAYIESVRPQVTTQAKEALAAAGEAAIPSLINGLNGLDLRDERSFVTAANLVLAIQESSCDVIRIPFRTELRAMQENMHWNLRCLHSLIDFWKRYGGPESAEDLARFREKVAQRLAEKAATSPEKREGG